MLVTFIQRILQNQQNVSPKVCSLYFKKIYNVVVSYIHFYIYFLKCSFQREFDSSSLSITSFWGLLSDHNPLSEQVDTACMV